MRSSLRVLLGMCLLLSSCVFGPAPGSQWVGMVTPPARFTMLDGTRVSIDAFSGKTTVVVFWKSDCSKSRRVLESMRDFAVKYEQRPAVEFIAANIDKADKRQAVEARIRQLDSKKILFAFSGNDVLDEAYRLFEGIEVPYVIVIDAHGNIIAVGGSAGVFEGAVY